MPTATSQVPESPTTHQGPVAKRAASLQLQNNSRDPGTSVDYFEKIIWPSYLRWNSIPLGLWESQQTAPDDSQLVEEAKGQQQAEHQASKPSAREGGFFFINGEDDVDTVFRLAVEHITARKHAHLVC